LLFPTYREKEGLVSFGNWELLKRLLDAVVKVKWKSWDYNPGFVAYILILWIFFFKLQTTTK